MHFVFLLAFSLSLNFSGLFQTDEEKELISLHTVAEKAIEQTDWSKAKSAYSEIISKIEPPESSGNKYKAEWPDFVDAYLRLGEVYLNLGETDCGKELLNTLKKFHPPSTYLPNINFLEARFIAKNGDLAAAYLLMKEIKESLPKESWTGKELSFFHAIEFSLDDHYLGELTKASCFFAAGFYIESAQIYEKVLSAIEKGYFPKANDPLILHKVRYHLAECYFELALFDKSSNLLDSLAASDKSALYLAAKAHLERQDYERAVECLKGYLSHKEPVKLAHYGEALYELGQHYLKKGETSQAKECFQAIPDNKGRLTLLTKLELAKIALNENQIEEALSGCFEIGNKIKKEDPLYFEILNLRAKAAFQTEDFKRAITLYEELFTNGHFPFYEELAYHLALSYIRLEEKENQPDLLNRAHTILERLVKGHPKEPFILLLGKVYLKKNEKEKLRWLFTEYDPSLSLDGKIQANLLIAESKESLFEKRALYNLASAEPFSSSSLYPAVLFLSGVNELKIALSTQSEKKNHLEAARSLLQRALYFTNPSSPLMLPLLKEEAKLTFYLGEPKKALSTLDALIQEENLPENKEELLYLSGLILAKGGQKNSADLAIDRFSSLLHEFPQGHFADSASFGIAILLMNEERDKEAKEWFLDLVNRFPASSYAGKSLFFAAECEEEGALKLKLRERCYVEYPSSAFADEAYLKMFSLDDYLNGKSEALSHLKSFEEKFPSSHFLAAAHFCLGYHEEKWQIAKEHFLKAIQAYEPIFKHLNNFESKSPSCYSFEKKADPSLQYLFLRAHIELAKLLMEKEKNVSLASNYLLQLESFCQNQSLPPQLFEEGQFYLARSLIELNNLNAAEERLFNLLRHFKEKETLKGALISKIWMEQAKIALIKNDLNAASSALTVSEDCGKGFLSQEEFLELWLLQSELFFQQNRFDLAMRTLSKVINEDVVSNLRLKAMYKRAEIYEKEKRYVLAYRQLEALAKKGGEWAQKAKEKLKAEYGVE